jgi:hypothetical protein
MPRGPTHSSTRVVIGPATRAVAGSQRRERLSDIVVQVARKTPAFPLLHLSRRRDSAQALFGHLELAGRLRR